MSTLIEGHYSLRLGLSSYNQNLIMFTLFAIGQYRSISSARRTMHMLHQRLN